MGSIELGRHRLFSINRRPGRSIELHRFNRKSGPGEERREKKEIRENTEEKREKRIKGREKREERREKRIERREKREETKDKREERIKIDKRDLDSSL